MTLRRPEFCGHDSEIVFTSTEGPLCGDCHAPMAWIAVSLIETYTRVINDQAVQIARLRHEIEDEGAEQ